MQGKGIIKFFAIALIVVCIYQLSFTLVTNRIDKHARKYAENGLVELLDPSNVDTMYGGDKVLQRFYVDSIQTLIKKKNRIFLDSISGEVVFNIFVTKFTYQKCKRQELNLGLDLKGGISVTLQVSLIDLIITLSDYNKDASFREALAETERRQSESNDDFVTLFGKTFKELYPDGSLAVIFATRENSDYITYNSTNDDVLKFINREADDAVTRTFNILRTRVDQFGVAQPNINLQQTTGRIIVELPGIDDPERVRNLLQASAKLEFWETYDNAEVINDLIKANETLEKKYGSPFDTTNTGGDSTTLFPDNNDSLAENNGINTKTDSLDSIKTPKQPSLFSEGAPESTKTSGDKPMLNKESKSLFAILQPSIQQDEKGENRIVPGPMVGSSLGKDTAKVNLLLRTSEVMDALPKNIKFLWGAKPLNDNKKAIYGLYCIKTGINKRKAPLGGDVISSAYQDFGNTGKAEVIMNMNAEGAAIWKKMTAANIKKSIAIVIDGFVVSAPTVQNEIPNGRSSISGNFTMEEAKDLATILKAGKFPAPARIIEEEIVGPSLGKESIRSGLISLLAGFLIVLIFMLFYYSSAGTVADLALFANVFFIVGVLASLGFTLTLPGIAGVVLTIGMCVDANVIIFERIREELAKGKGMRLAIVDGYKHSYSSIVDANVTTLLTAIILAYFGAGPILGFAVVLIIGIISSLFAAVLLTQVAFDWLVAHDKPIKFYTRATKNAFTNLAFDFIASRKLAYGISGAIIFIGLISIFTRGFEMGVDFKGGRSFVVRFDEPVQTADIQKALAVTFGKTPLVRTFGGSNQIKITTSFLIDDNTLEATDSVEAKLFEGLSKILGPDVTFEKFTKQHKMSSQRVGPSIADDIKRGAIFATIFGLVVIFIYILIRFRKWQYGLGAVIALFHDVLIVLSMFSIFKGLLPFSIEIDQAFIAALLTIIGYSINDTVIIFDRIREYFTLHHTESMGQVINKAVNNTLSRTIMTSFTTLFVIIVLFIFGGEVIRGFTFALLIGIVAGTYSSVFIATPIVYDLSKKGKIK